MPDSASAESTNPLQKKVVKILTKAEFLEQTKSKYKLSGYAYQLVSNILDYVKLQNLNETEQHAATKSMLKDVIELSDDDLNNLEL